MTYQQTSNPYSADVLTPHEAIFVREFGTETTDAVGDAFTSTAGTTVNPAASINARLGMLELDSIDFQGDASVLSEPRGRTFLLPEWDTFESPPLTVGEDPDFKVVALLAHILFREETQFPPEIAGAASLVLGPETLIGDAQAVPMVTCNIVQPDYASPPMERETAKATLEAWVDGGQGGEGLDGTLMHVPNGVYFRVMMFGSAIKQTEVQVQVSFDGIWWLQLGEAELGQDGPDSVVRRVGLSSQGRCIANLDWIRLYNYPVTAFTAGGDLSFLPPPPITGGRIFVP